MVSLRSVAGRVAIGKMIGLIVGLVCLAFLPGFGFPTLSFFGLGTLIMFVLMGTLIGFVGQFDRHPALDFAMPWWFRGSAVGFAFMLMFVLLSYGSLEFIMQSSLIAWTGLQSPFWALIDGVIIGMLMAYCETRFAGEGSTLPLR